MAKNSKFGSLFKESSKSPQKKEKKKIGEFQRLKMAARARFVHTNARALKMPGRLLALDLSLNNTGMIVFSEEGYILRSCTLRHGIETKDLSPRELRTKKTERLIAIINEIIGVCKFFSVCYVGIEGYSYKSQFQSHQIGEIGGALNVQLWLALKIIPYIIPPAQGRKFLFDYAGHDQGDLKNVVFDILVNECNLFLEDEHQADAYVTGRYCFNLISADKQIEKIVAVPELEGERDIDENPTNDK